LDSFPALTAALASFFDVIRKRVKIFGTKMLRSKGLRGLLGVAPVLKSGDIFKRQITGDAALIVDDEPNCRSATNCDSFLS
jgi:hypothetical protein